MASLGIERAHHVALRVPDPGAAAAFAVEKMGFLLAHVADDGAYYLRAHGPDPYSLVYRRGEAGIDHIGYLVAEADGLHRAEASLRALGVALSPIEDHGEWRHGPSLRFRTPAGHEVELTEGLHLDVPVGASTPQPEVVPGPIACDHVALRAVDVDGELEFAATVLGLRESARIVAPEPGTLIAFFRGRWLFHCLAVARSSSNGLHHVQFTLKNPLQLYAAHEAMLEAGVEMIWGPVRHGPGHNIALYFRDGAGNFIEYSTEEEVVFDGDTYVPRVWSASDQKALDEWGTLPPPEFFR